MERSSEAQAIPVICNASIIFTICYFVCNDCKTLLVLDYEVPLLVMS